MKYDYHNNRVLFCFYTAFVLLFGIPLTIIYLSTKIFTELNCRLGIYNDKYF